MNTYKGFLFGHYDSRGGASFYVGMAREEADKDYLLSFALDDKDPEYTTYCKNIIEEDFLGEATLFADAPPKNGEDIEYREDGQTLWVKFAPADGGETTHGLPGTYELRISATQPEGYEESELGEDAFGVLFITEQQQ